MKLTSTILEKLPTPSGKDALISDDLTVGLFVKVSHRTGRKTFIYRVRRQNKWTVRKLGTHPVMTLAKARSEATALHTRSLPESITLSTLLDSYYETRVEKNHKDPSYAASYIRWAKNSKLGNMRLHALTTAAVTAELRTYAATSPVAANRALSTLSCAFKFALELGYIDRSPLEHTTKKSIGGSEVSRERVLDTSELRWLWSLEDDSGSRDLLKFLLLTGCRINEAITGHLEGDIWKIPTTKNGRAHDVALSPLAKALVPSFSGITNKRSINHWLSYRIERDKVKHFCPHDLRRTFCTSLAQLGVDFLVIEACVNHTLRGVARIYHRYSYDAERKAALIKWSDHVEALVSQ